MVRAQILVLEIVKRAIFYSYSMNSLIGCHSILSGVIGGQLKSGLREKGAGKGVSLNSAGEGLTPIHSRPFRRYQNSPKSDHSTR